MTEEESYACRNCGAKRPVTATWIFVPSQWGLIPICWHCWALAERDGGWLAAIALQQGGRQPPDGTAPCRDSRCGGPFSSAGSAS
jgi:hypothetical protein